MYLSFVLLSHSYKSQKHSRAYFGFKAPEDVYDFAAFFNGHVFVNDKGIFELFNLSLCICFFFLILEIWLYGSIVLC